jgi:RNA polymerase sigma-70 factor (TIGR02943 family)
MDVSPNHGKNLHEEKFMGFEHDVAEQRTYLLKFARLQLRNESWAEDAVSETMLAAIAKPQAFGGKAQLRTWLVGVLKHKVVDILRTNLREPNVTDLQGNKGGSEDDMSEGDLIDALGFKADGHYEEAPAKWGNPDQDLSQKQFMAVMDACVSKLPAVQGRLFLMREWLELDAEEVCKTLNLTSTNLYVQLHRARLKLRECLQLNWFGQQAEAQ